MLNEKIENVLSMLLYDYLYTVEYVSGILNMASNHR